MRLSILGAKPVDVDGADHAEASLLQSESQAATAAEDVECGSSGHIVAAEASTLDRLGGDPDSGDSSRHCDAHHLVQWADGRGGGGAGKGVVAGGLMSGLDAHTDGLRQQYDNLLSVMDRPGNTLATVSERLAPGQSPDPDGEVAPALEQAEGCFKRRQEQLRRSRRAFVEAGASPSHGVFEALDRLDNLYTWSVATMQEVRWAVLISEGLRDKAESPEGRSFTSSAEWLASLREQ